MRILVTNDDGVFSEGLKCLAQAMTEIAEVVVVAPDREQSASGHSLTLHRPLRMRRLREHWYSVDGTPTDCVNMAVQGVLKEAPPDLVVSGINYGVNMGDDVTYSGTVSAAFEANMHQLPAVAFSQEVGEGFDFERSASFARELVEVLTREDLPQDLLLNVNFPAERCRGIRWTRLGKRYYQQTVVEKLDPMGRKYYWIAGTPRWESQSGTDHEAVTEGFASVTPLHLDLTDYRSLEESAPLRDRLEHLELR
ncbi:MAG: 5'/3'-nucleotidase SurE [Thermoanaerobaculia bacterium]|nr:5'/3'-nucleotidase SurE [Thermoanaerobaculia bacterium]